MKMIDIHTHGIGGFDTCTTSEDQILRMAEIQGGHGIPEIIPTIYPSPVKTMRAQMLAVKKAMKIQVSGVRCHGSGSNFQNRESKIIGINLEGPFINPARCGALDAGSFLEPREHSLKKLLEGFEDIVKIITIAPEIKGATQLIKLISDMGIIVSMGHSEATYAEAEAGFHAGARGTTHLFNAMSGIHHREPGLAGFALMNSDIYVEVIADPFHLDRHIIEFIFSVKDPGKIIIVSDTVKGSGTTSAAHEKITNEQGRLIGGSLPLKESSERLIHQGLDKDTVYKTVSENPQTYLKTYR
jgi:N-acetylglucosamine-6-phosphate deacetylase